MQLIYPVTQRSGAEYDRSCSYNGHGPANVSAPACICRIKKMIVNVLKNAIHFTTNSNVYDVKKTCSKLIRRAWG